MSKIEIMVLKIKNLTIVAVLIILLSCSTYSHIYTNYDKSIDFNQYHTFAWAADSSKTDEADESAYDNDIVRNNAKNYITYNLTQRGYMVRIDSPDLVLRLVLLNEKKEKIVTYHSNNMGYYYYYSPFYFPYYYPYYRFYTWYGWGYPPFWGDQTTTYTKTYIKGTITINMYDRKLKKLVWTGSAEGDIYDPAYLHMGVHPAIDRILKRFPVKILHKMKKNDELKMKHRIVISNGMMRNFKADHTH